MMATATRARRMAYSAVTTPSSSRTASRVTRVRRGGRVVSCSATSDILRCATIVLTDIRCLRFSGLRRSLAPRGPEGPRGGSGRRGRSLGSGRLSADPAELGVGLVEHACDGEAERGCGRDDCQRDEDEKQAVLRRHHAPLVTEARRDAGPCGAGPYVQTEHHFGHLLRGAVACGQWGGASRSRRPAACWPC